MSNIKIRSIEEVSPLENISLVDFSYSRLDTYGMCPSKYFYSYIQKEPRTSNSAALLGNIVHSVLEECVDQKKELDLGQLHLEYEKQKSNYDPDSNIPNELINVGSEILTEFYDKHSEEDFSIYEKELGFRFVIGTYVINGYIDRIDLYDDETINIIDYKTGKWEVAQKNIKDNLQLGIYAIAMSLLFPDKKIRAELYYLRSGKRKAHLYTQEDIENAKVSLVEKIGKIMQDTSFSPTGNERVCGFCENAQSGACAVGVNRLRKWGK
jgi:DNA helicase-2/ATP-dependent DNA helicase PcrA